MDIIVTAGIFFAVVLFIEGSYFAFRSIRNPEKKKIRSRLQALSFAGYENEGVDIIRNTLMSEIPWLNRLLLRFHWTNRLNRLLEQAEAQRNIGTFLLVSLLLAFGGLWIGLLVTGQYLISLLSAAFLGAIPFLLIYLKKKGRMLKFQRQFPEVMDLIARSLKAGHAFSGGLKMVADEFDDPTGVEFSRLVHEVNFGVSMLDALKNLSSRLDSPDLRFFVIAVIIQRESGGNLAEILENIAHLVRERQKLQGRIRALSAEGKFSAYVLIAIPLFVSLFLYAINPEYMRTLARDSIGKIMIIGVLIMMIAGVFVMRKIIKIKV